MGTNVNRRKWSHLLTHSSFQLRLILANLFFLIMMILSFCSVLLSTFYYDLKMADSLWMRYASAEALLRLIDRGGIMIIMIIVISIVYYIVFSHRLCGPLVNMMHTFETLAQGDATRNVYLRRNDFLKTEAKMINKMLGAIGNRIMELQNSQAEIASLARQLPHGPIEGRLKECLENHQKLLNQWVVNQSPAKTSFHVTSTDP